jgi:putative addiction module component (TIGR02574 family)
MVKAVPIPPPGFDELSAEEKLDYVQSLWDRIAASPEEVPVPEWHKQIISERLAAYRANPNEGRTWEQIRTDLEQRLTKKPSK